jgi:DNA polymerase-3 subunit alpha
LGITGSALTDHGNVSGAIAFTDALIKKDLKPIIGCELYICPHDPKQKDQDNKKLSHLVVLAKNLQGWKELIEITSTANEPEFFWYRPRLDIPTLASLPHDNIIAFTGHYGSTVTDCFFEDSRLASTASKNGVRAFVKNRMDTECLAHLSELREIFGENFFVEIQLIDAANNPASQFTVEYLRKFAKKLGIPTVATPDAHYCKREDAILQQILLCTRLGNSTFLDIRRMLNKKEHIPLASFFKTANFHIPSYDDMVAVGNTEEELINTLEIEDRCESYKLTGRPMLPKFPCPDGMTAERYLHELCLQGFKQDRQQLIEDVKNRTRYTSKDYDDRYKKEKEVISGAGLSDYFLIVNDFVQFARNNDILVGAGRGSAAGSLTLYLLGVTQVDPIEYDLMFERFYNAGRNTEDRISLPDIDMDFESGRRGEVIDYIKEKYGRDKVTQMITFSRMQGRSALKDVLRTRNACSANEMNRITEFIPGEEEISDQLEDMKESGIQLSIIMWSLLNHSKELNEWVHLDSDGNIQGKMGAYFKQAMALEGTKRSQGKHAAGIVISGEPLKKVCPMVYDPKSGETVAGMEMGDLEAAGHVKFDILGLTLLDKLTDICVSLGEEDIPS